MRSCFLSALATMILALTAVPAQAAPIPPPKQYFGFEIGKVAKYAGLAPEQLRLVLGENLARVLGVTTRREGRKKVELTRI